MEGRRGKEGKEREGRQPAWPDLQFSLCDATGIRKEWISI